VAATNPEGEKSTSYNMSQSLQAKVLPAEFTTLRTGGPGNGLTVDAISSKAGGVFGPIGISRLSGSRFVKVRKDFVMVTNAHDEQAQRDRRQADRAVLLSSILASQATQSQQQQHASSSASTSPHAQTIIAAADLAFEVLSVPIEVMTRHTFGERYLTLKRVLLAIVVYMVLLWFFAGHERARRAQPLGDLGTVLPRRGQP